MDCAGGHAAEVYLVTEISGDEYPGEQAVQNAASELCHDPFADYVGVEYEDSALEVIYFWPKQRRWDHGDHGVMCAAFDPKGPLTGSVKGTSR